MNMKQLFSLFLAITLLFCSGCSKVTFGYNNFDWYLLYRINGYTTFNAWQKEDIHREVDHYMRWHRKNALPEYTRFLQNLHDTVRQDRQINAGDIAGIKNDSYRLYRKTMGPFILPAARLLKSLDERQIEELGRNFAETIREQKEESLGGSEQENLAKRAERTLDFVEDMVGSLSSEQKGKIRELSLRLPFATHYYIEHREANYAKLVALLNNKAEEDKIAEFLWLWLNAPQATRTPRQQQAIESHDHAIDRMTAQIHGMLTDAQKNRLRQTLSSYIEDFQSLSQ